MNNHYQAAVAALRETDRLGIATEATSMASMQTQATLAVAAEQAKTNQHLELANLIAYAHMRRERRRFSFAAEELVDIRMAALFPEIAAELAEDDD
jgi:hypothetical protein